MKKVNSSKSKFLVFLFAAVFASVAALPMLFSQSVAAEGVASAILFTTQGTLSVNGQYAQSSGNFTKVVEGTPTPTPTPNPSGCVPSPGSSGGTIYIGTYTLSNSENGDFTMIVNNGTNDSIGVGAPEDVPDNPVVVEQGNAIVALQINRVAQTGAGTINFTSGGTAINGTITIVSGFNFPASQPVRCSRPNSLDLDGDGKADVGVFRPTDGAWYFSRSTAGFSAVHFGQNGDRIAPADYDGDGKSDVAVYRNGAWYILQTTNNQMRSVNYGTAEDLPRPGDFDGDGKADIAVFRPSTGTWFYQQSSNNLTRGVKFGQAGDVPMMTDLDGDAKTDITVFRPSNGGWYWIKSSDNTVQSALFGQNGDVPLNGDFNGDGKGDLAVFRPSTGSWYVAKPTGTPAQNFDATKFGVSTDTPVAADFDGDGKTDIAVFRAAEGRWYILQNNNQLGVVRFGQNGDKPVQSMDLQ